MSHQFWNGSNARINSEAQSPDGDYRVWVMAYDYIGNGGDTLNHIGAEDEDASIDNFIPYVKQVDIEQDEYWKLLRYRAYWGYPIDNYNLGELIDNEAPGLCYSGMVTIFTIIFSEKMLTAVLPMLTVELPDGSEKTVPDGYWLNDTTYEATTEEYFFDDEDEGEATLCISLAQDLAYNLNDGYPGTIAYRDENGNWRQDDPYDPLLGEGDDSYKFWINPPPQVVSTDPPSEGGGKDGGGRDGDGAEDVDIYKKITIVFNKPMDTTSVIEALEIKNIDNSSLVEIREVVWQDDDKMMIIRAYDPVVLDDTTGFDFLTNYEVTIKGTAEDTRFY